MPFSHQTKPSPSFPFTGDGNVGACVLSYNQTKPNHPSTSPHRPSGWERGCKTGRKDGRDLVGEWQRRHPQGQAVHTREELRQVNFNSTEQLLGLFAHSMMPYDDERESEGMITPR